MDSKGVYTLKEVSSTAFPAKGTKVAQSAIDADTYTNDEIKIDKKNVSLAGLGSAKVYGNNDTVYLAVSTEPIKANTDAGSNKHWHAVINDVDSVTVGARNASLVAKQQAAGDGTNKEDSTGSAGDGPKPAVNEVYPLFKDNGYIIAAVVIGEDDGVSKSFAYIHSDSVKRERYDKADDEWTWVREAIVDGKIVDLTEVGGGTDLSTLEDLDQGKWYELKFDADNNVKGATEQIFTGGTAGTAEARERIDEVLDVELSVNAYDTVILQQVGMAGGADSKLTYKNGTLYTTEDQSKALGFSVSPDVKVVLCLSDGEGTDWDDCDDTYTGYAGLERAIRNLDSNFVGELNAVFDSGDAVVIILVDTTDAEDVDDDDDDNTPADVYDINLDDPAAVEVLVDKNATAEQKAERAALSAVIAAIRAEGYTVADGAATKATNTWTIVATDDAIKVEFKWDVNSDFDVAAITVTVGSSSKLMGATDTIADLGAGEYAKVSGSTTSSDNGFKAKTTTLVEGATYDIGYYEVSVANTGWTLESITGTGLVDDTTGTSKYYAKTGVAVTAVMEETTASAIPTTHEVTVTGGPTGTAGEVTRAGTVGGDATQVTITFTVASADAKVTAFTCAAP